MAESKPPPPPAKPKAGTREARLAAALRGNLKRRKTAGAAPHGTPAKSSRED